MPFLMRAVRATAICATLAAVPAAWGQAAAKSVPAASTRLQEAERRRAATQVDAGAIRGHATRRNGISVSERLLEQSRAGDLRRHRVRGAAIQLARQIRVRHGVAQLHQAAATRQHQVAATTAASAWIEPRFAQRMRIRISATCSTTDRSRPACDTASTRRHCASFRRTSWSRAAMANTRSRSRQSRSSNGRTTRSRELLEWRHRCYFLTAANKCAYSP